LSGCCLEAYSQHITNLKLLLAFDCLFLLFNWLLLLLVAGLAAGLAAHLGFCLIVLAGHGIYSTRVLLILLVESLTCDGSLDL
jgi:uncharacterized membrane protein